MLFCFILSIFAKITTGIQRNSYTEMAKNPFSIPIKAILFSETI